mmetsp:Transcript_10165/g.19198  ORF Transcript_10165/g.19198 Transcript_10165/m.19198 type:complete len:213 (+) Transcript_10165:1107-1745(+)
MSSLIIARILATMSLLCKKSHTIANRSWPEMVRWVRGSRISHTMGTRFFLRTSQKLVLSLDGVLTTLGECAELVRPVKVMRPVKLLLFLCFLTELSCKTRTGPGVGLGGFTVLSSDRSSRRFTWMARMSTSVARQAESDCMISVSRDSSDRISTDVYSSTGASSKCRRMHGFPTRCLICRLDNWETSKPPSASKVSRSSRPMLHMMCSSVLG